MFELTLDAWYSIARLLQILLPKLIIYMLNTDSSTFLSLPYAIGALRFEAVRKSY